MPKKGEGGLGEVSCDVVASGLRAPTLALIGRNGEGITISRVSFRDIGQLGIRSDVLGNGFPGRS